MAGERIDYTAAAVEAAKSVPIELMHILGEYRDDMVLVGGWIPDLLIPTSSTGTLSGARLAGLKRAQRSRANARAQQIRASLVGDGRKGRITNLKQAALVMATWRLR